MSKGSSKGLRLLACMLVSAALIAPPALAAPDSDPAPPPRSDGKSGKKKQSEQRFQDGYRAAYATIYERGDYASGIDQLQALGRDDNASVATLLGYSHRKLGDTRLAQAYYERALKTDPNHVRTWQYYGLWQVEQGNRERAQYHLDRIAALCGNTACEEYTSLADAIGRGGGSY
ncbi:tetratricopeptide repeat protein [Rhodopseudomonas sp. NSM]|uniref:tetratricopeptide repeat protein n=1 Tax=Rhodopseudomonas sp. NSM TaxID=3457630 RepID=UPI00403652DA